MAPKPAEAHAPAVGASAPAAATDASLDPAQQPTPSTTAAAAGAAAAGTQPAGAAAHGSSATGTTAAGEAVGATASDQTPAKPGTIADYLNKTEAALDKVDDGKIMGGKFDGQIKYVQDAIDKVQGSGLL